LPKVTIKIFANNKEIATKQSGENLIEIEAKAGEVYRVG
jgi:hypothetical protein